MKDLEKLNQAKLEQASGGVHLEKLDTAHWMMLEELEKKLGDEYLTVLQAINRFSSVAEANALIEAKYHMVQGKA